jgi:hypothetical protein
MNSIYPWAGAMEDAAAMNSIFEPA